MYVHILSRALRGILWVGPVSHLGIMLWFGFWQSIRYNKAIAVSVLWALLSHSSAPCSSWTVICQLMVWKDVVRFAGSTSWHQPWEQLLWNTGWPDAPDSSCKASQTAFSAKLTLFWFFSFHLCGGSNFAQKTKKRVYILRPLECHWFGSAPRPNEPMTVPILWAAA